jgi:hypothetical protein
MRSFGIIFGITFLFTTMAPLVFGFTAEALEYRFLFENTFIYLLLTNQSSWPFFFRQKLPCPLSDHQWQK